MTVLAVLAAAGCAGGAPEASAASEPGLPEAVPRDFTINAAVLEMRPGRAHPRSLPRRYTRRIVVFPDGALHYGAAEDRDPRWMPEIRRVLDRDQIAELWTLSRA
ncbi:MAG: hypothetical protein ACYTGC_19660, partial [Planctomycetota bacterium]